MKNQEQVIPNRLSGGPMELPDQEIKKGVYVFEQALLFMANYFNQSSIKIVYIPSPASSYSLVSPVVIKNYMHSPQYSYKIDAGVLYKRSDDLCHAIEKVAIHHNFDFLDTRKFFRIATKTDFIHGPEDWGHLNKKGYHVLENAIFTAFYNTNRAESGFGCDTAL
tara:strand:- start:319 stop:813 length:495 start_codon:yes stop_codon:yes gene_type:complete